MNYEYIVVLGAIGAVNVMGWLSPGPNMLAVISASISKGRRTGFATALGLSLGGMLWAIAVVLGAVSLFELFPKAVFMLRMFGAGYLIWLGVKFLRSVKENRITPLEVSQVDYSDWVAFRTGFFVVITNPKAAVFFSSVFAAFIPVNAPIWLLAVIVIASPLQAFVQHCIIATVFSSKTVVQRYQAASRVITGAIGVLYCGLGLGVATDAMRRFS
jgi:threonine/homoserine/homoserine lactone efflux protein